MNIKLKSSICVTILFFFAMFSLQAQERYLSQSDIDNFIANYDAIGNDGIMDSIASVDFSSLETLPTATAFIDSLGDFKGPLSKLLQKYGLNSKYPIEAYYTITIGMVILMLDTLIESVILMSGLDFEEEVMEEMIEEMRQDPEFVGLFELGESIHPDDLSLITENIEAFTELIVNAAYDSYGYGYDYDYGYY